ncbi:MAG: FtsW/RodA/SpoVE family cell cycle protein [Candidatus Competibacter sp.]
MSASTAEKGIRFRWRSRAGRGGLLAIWLLPVLAALWTVERAPDWLEPRQLTVELEPGQSLTLGREALWAPRADDEHILLHREANGAWRLSNLSSGKRVLWRPASAGDGKPTREWLLMSGASFAVGAHPFTVSGAENGRLILHDGDRRWEYDGLRLRRDGQLLPECRQDWRSRLREWLSSAELPFGWVQRPLRLGGGVYCADRLGLGGVPLDTAEIVPTREGFVLCPGEAGRPDGSPVTVKVGTPDAESLWQRSVPLHPGDGLIIGRTHYRVVETAPTLTLAVMARARRWLAESSPPSVSPAVSVSWSGLAWLWPLDQQLLDWRFGLVLSPLILGGVWPGRRQGWPAATVRWQIALALTLAGLCFEMHLKALTMAILWPYLVAWPALLIWLETVRSRWSVGLLTALTLLLGSGLVTLLQLGVGAGEAGWQRYGGSGAALAGVFGWLAWAGWSAWPWMRPTVRLDRHWASWGLGLLGIVAMALLAVQTISGDEGGWAGLQPFELILLVLVAVAAHALTLRERSPVHGWSHDYSVPWLRYLGFLILLTAVCGFALMFLHDFSPLALLVFWSLALAWAYLRAHPFLLWRRMGLMVVMALILSLVAGLAWLRDRPEGISLDFQMDRIRVWVAPDQYPHAGYQLRRALEAIRAGGWAGTVWNETANGRAMTVPVVESDFAPSFFLSRYGGLAGLVLVGGQALFVALMVIIANRALNRGWSSDNRPTMVAGFVYFFLYGGAALLSARFLVSWGTNLGFLPVMGQPMPLLSAAGSHLVLSVLPIVALAVVVEEKGRDNSS